MTQAFKVRIPRTTERAARCARPVGRDTEGSAPHWNRVVVIFQVALFITSLAAVAVAVNPSFVTVVQPGSMVTNADFIVFGDGVNYFARNGTTGTVQFSGTNASSVLQSAINARRVIGGSIQFNGVIQLTWGLTIYPSISLSGMGMLAANIGGYSALKVPATLPVPAITVMVDPSFLTDKYFPELHDFSIDSASGTPNNHAGQDGILITSVNGAINDMNIQNVGVFQMGANGLNISLSSGKVWVDSSYFEGNRINQVAVSGAPYVRISNSFIFGLIPGQTGSGVYTNQTGGNLALVGNKIWNNVNDGLMVRAFSSPSFQLQVSACDFHTNSLYAIDLKSNDAATLVTGNIFLQNGQLAAADSGGAVLVWSATGRIMVSSNLFQDNGGSSNAAVLWMWNPGSNVSFVDNAFLDTRGSATGAKNFIYNSGGTIIGSITGNAMDGIYPNPTINIVNLTSKLLIRDNHGYNDVLGKITNPFRNNYLGGITNVGLAGNATSPASGKTYTVYCVDVLVTTQGGTVSNITVKDRSGTLVAWGMTTTSFLFVPIGYQITWTYAAVPTIIISGN